MATYTIVDKLEYIFDYDDNKYDINSEFSGVFPKTPIKTTYKIPKTTMLDKIVVTVSCKNNIHKVEKHFIFPATYACNVRDRIKTKSESSFLTCKEVYNLLKTYGVKDSDIDAHF